MTEGLFFWLEGMIKFGFFGDMCFSFSRSLSSLAGFFVLVEATEVDMNILFFTLLNRVLLFLAIWLLLRFAWQQCLRTYLKEGKCIFVHSSKEGTEAVLGFGYEIQASIRHIKMTLLRSIE